MRAGPLRGIVVLCLWLVAFEGQAADRAPFFSTYCVDCHGPGAKKGGFRVDELPQSLADTAAFARWVRVFDKVSKGEMPPKKSDQPTAAERKLFVDGLQGELVEADQKQAAAGLQTSVRRLNRVEYENTLRDLLALPNLRVKDSLPEDGQQHGFDKVAGALDISPIHMSKYLEAADAALRQAVMRDPKAPETRTWREPAAKQYSMQAAMAIHCAVPLKGRELAPGLSTHIVGNPVKDIGNTYRGATFRGDADSAAVLTGVIGAHQPDGIQIDRFQPTAPGWYRVRFSIWGLRWERTKAVAARRGLVRRYTVFGPPYEFDEGSKRWKATPLSQEKPDAGRLENVEFYGEGEATHVIRASLKGEPLGFFDAPSLKPTTHEFKVWLNPGEKISFHAMTLPATGSSNSASHNGVVTYEGPGVAYDWFEVQGPMVDQWPPESQKRLFGETATKDHRSLLQNFAGRAFRRPVTASEVDRYAAIVSGQLDRGTSFEEAMLAGYKAILCSPDFLFVGLEGGAYALASRLSYFLWNSMPDATLLAVAKAGDLAKPDVLRTQVDRLLNDSRSDRFVEHFLDEWLEMKKIDFTMPDPQLYPEFDPWLRDSMLAETRGYFRKLLAEDRSVSHLVASDYVMINQRLAELYGIRGIAGAELRPVPVPAGSKRGGILTQAAVLKVTANGTATSPVLRGVWIIERLLGVPRNPPPPNVPAVEPDATGAVTIRQMIEKHRADPACSSCHAKMDPPGLALESFDVIGGLRDRYRLSGTPKKIRKGKVVMEEPSIEIVSESARRNRVKLRLGSPVDASGELAEGQKFNDVDGLRSLLLADTDSLARNMATQFTIYATGCGIHFRDRSVLEAIVTNTRSQKHGIRSILHAVVQSEVFRRSTAEPGVQR